MEGKNYCILDFLIGGMQPQHYSGASDHQHLIGRAARLCVFPCDKLEKMNRGAAVCAGAAAAGMASAAAAAA